MEHPTRRNDLLDGPRARIAQDGGCCFLTIPTSSAPREGECVPRALYGRGRCARFSVGRALRNSDRRNWYCVPEVFLATTRRDQGSPPRRRTYLPDRALGLEMFGAREAELSGYYTYPYSALYTLEEMFEMAGIILFTYGLLLVLAREQGRLTCVLAVQAKTAPGTAGEPEHC